MAVNLTAIAYASLRDIGCLRPGQVTSTDVMADILAETNALISEWAMRRFFVYTGTSPTFTVLAAFPDLTTAYSFAQGHQWLLQKAIAAAIVPKMKVYFKIPEPLIDAITAQAEAAYKALQGVGPQ